MKNFSRTGWILVLAALALALPAAAVAKRKAVSQAPDLVAKKLTLTPASVAAGDSAKVELTIVNRGKHRAGKSTTGFWISYDAKQSKGDVLAGSANLNGIKYKRSKRAKLTFTVPIDFPVGRYYIIACADALKKVAEDYERNNCRAVKIAVTPPSALAPQ